MKKYQGLLLLEMILVIVVMSIILMLTLRYFVFTHDHLKVTRAVTQIQTLVKASNQWLSAQRQANYAGSTPDTSITIDKLTAAGLIALSDTQHAWGGDITVAPASEDASYVEITFNAIPGKACVDLMTRMASVAHQQATRKNCMELKKYFIEL